ncbi:hypothetical protein OAA11_00400 [Schleiferiaceae bacterium]|nr:hypothetical protein [Schleiferiaceae bacterium]|tara:strand:+ start:734 stop:2032 length:1299 start_codon:yes stop_codon:yes gene_type:complete
MKKLITVLSKGTLPFIIAISALSVSASAAFYSVSGLSKLFAGATFEVIIMAGSLEVAKLVTASLLYQYWDTINKTLRAYLSIATVILVLITSMGIYGFLSAAYQETYQKLSINENRIEFLDQKREFYQQDVTRYDTELARISENISTLSNAKATGIQVRDTTSTTGFRNTISTTELRLAQNRIEVEEQNRNGVQSRREIAADSLQKYQLEILDLENNTEITGELGPLQYLSGLTGTPMDRIINWLLLVIIFVFDPLAISLVVAANFAFAQAFPKKEEDLILELPGFSFDDEEEEDEFNPLPSDAEAELYPTEKPKEDLSNWDIEEVEKRMDIIGQNGNEGLHYDDKEIKEYISTAEDKIMAATKSIMEKQKIEDNKLNKEVIKLKNKLDLSNNEIKTLNKKLGFAEKDDYIDEQDPYLKKGKDPDYPDVKTY